VFVGGLRIALRDRRFGREHQRARVLDHADQCLRELQVAGAGCGGLLEPAQRLARLITAPGRSWRSNLRRPSS
jgi:hypothetical protein